MFPSWPCTIVAGSLAAFAIAAVQPAMASDTPAVPVLTWQPCTIAAQAGFLCATAQVPVDYTQPDGASFTLALIKHPADDPANQLGTLFWNPGGPTDSGTVYLPAAIDGFPAQVRSQFDIVSWDPRGMGGSTRPVVQCFDNEQEETNYLTEHFGSIPDIPYTVPELKADFTARIAINEICVAREGTLLAHVSTTENARDLDLLRQAVGVDKINYYGTSYGTYLGATYINMFPDKVRAAVLDGAVYPTSWAGNNKDATVLNTFLRIGSDLGAAETLTAFLSACGEAGPAHCAFADQTPEATIVKWNTLLARLAINPVTVDNIQYTKSYMVSYWDNSTYTILPVPGFTRFPGFTYLANLMQQVWVASESGNQSAPPVAPPETPAPTTPSTYVTSYGRESAVICGESPNLSTISAEIKQTFISFRRAGLSNFPFTGVCMGWPIRTPDPYLGPWNKPTAPVLVVGNTFDPATPYASSQRTAREMYDGHFLTVDGFGHTQLLNPSKCAQDTIAAYLIDGTLPPDGTRCPQDSPPFP